MRDHREVIDIKSLKLFIGPYMSVLLAENVHELGYGEVTVLVDEALGTGGEALNTKISALQVRFR